MNAAAAAFVLAPALALGSFLNVVVARVPARRSILRPPSSCGSCETEILWRDNIPLVSYALLRGRCRHCDARISPLYPAVELVSAALIVACFAAFGLTAWAALAAGVLRGARRRSPRSTSSFGSSRTGSCVPAAAVALVAHTAIDPTLAWLVWALVAAGGLFLVVLAYPKGLGMGDVKLALLLGAMLGPSVTVALMIGLFAALIPSAVLVSRHGVAARKMGVPLVPFLSLGAVVALFFGDAVLDAYLGLF